MGKEYNLFPMLCSRPSIKDVKLPNEKEESPSFCSDPLSPRISCMGKVKRNNKITGFPTSHNKLNLSTKTNHSNLKRFFSAKNLTSTPAAASSAGDSRRRQLYKVGESGSDSISIVDLDPPLPVIKQVRARGEDGSLWKRRSHGIALQSLKLQPNQGYLDNHPPKPTTV